MQAWRDEWLAWIEVGGTIACGAFLTPSVFRIGTSHLYSGVELLSSNVTSQRSVLVTGAAGRIGSAFVREFADQYRWHLVDRVAPSFVPEGSTSSLLDVADLDACRAACEGIDTVIHLAADPSPEADFYGSLLDNNIKGTYNMFRAAKDAGCARIIFASSVHAIFAYPTDTPVPDGVPVRPANMYGVTKTFGEATGSAFAYGEGLSSICIRIGAYHNDWIKTAATPDNLCAYVSPRDLNQLADQMHRDARY